MSFDLRLKTACVTIRSPVLVRSGPYIVPVDKTKISDVRKPNLLPQTKALYPVGDADCHVANRCAITSLRI